MPDKTAAAGSHSSTERPFVRARFIVKRLRRMRRKVRSLQDDTTGNYNFCYLPSSPSDAASAASYESLLAGGLFGRTAIEEDRGCLDTISRRNRDLMRAEKVDYCQVEYAEPMTTTYTLSRSRARQSVESISAAGAESESSQSNHSDTISFTSADTLEDNLYEDSDDGMNLLESIERSLPEEYSLKKRLHCLHSVTMYRVLQRLNRQPYLVNYTPVHRKSLTLNNVSALIEGELRRLQIAMSIQTSQVEQARRALQLSLMTRTDIRHHLEVEKALLLAAVRQTTVEGEAEKWRRLQYLQDVFVEEESGSAVINKITVTVENESQWGSYYFVLVAVERDNVKGTELSCVSVDCSIQFHSQLHFHNLRPNFTITFYLYGITIKDQKYKMFHRSCERLNLIGRPVKPKWRNSLVEGLEHNFQLIGMTEVQSGHFNSTEMFLTAMIPKLSSDQLILEMQGTVCLDTRHSGFLDIRYSSGDCDTPSLWTKYWFRLAGMELMAYSNPTPDPEDQQNPTHVIHLSQCSNKEVRPVNRFTCVRPNCFSLDLRIADRIQNIYCAADCQEDLLAWCHHINNVFRASRCINSCSLSYF